MNMKDILLYIVPYAKILSKKGKGNYLLFDNVLIFLNDEESQLIVANLPIGTGKVMCISKDNLFSILQAISEDKTINLDGINWIDYGYYYKIRDMYTFYSSRYDLVSTINNITSIEDVYGFITMKRANEVPKLYNIQDNIVLPFFYGILPASKNDIIDVSIYYNDDFSNIAKYSITKAKPKGTIDVYMKLMNLG